VFDVIMETKYGTTYNSYFINADKKTIIETSKENFSEDYLNKVKSVVDPNEIAYIVLNHSEPDHTGSLKQLLKIAPNATVVGSGNAIRYLADIVGFEFRSKAVKDGDTLSLGNKTLRFISAPNLHWPDTMFTWLEEDRLLFTCDAFGEHYAHPALFDDKVGNFDEAFKYYFDVILRPFSKFLLKAIEKIKDLDIDMICPGHGAVLRTHWKKYVDLSAEYARQELEIRQPETDKVFIPYVSAYGYTKSMAEKIAEGIRKSGDIQVELCDIQDKDFFFLNGKIASSSALIVGSPTFNQNILPQIYTLFSAINPIRDKGKPFSAFGSYGWSGEGTDIIVSALSTLKLKYVPEALKIKFFPSEEWDQN
jgi:NADH oxidase (H2O-forming)